MIQIKANNLQKGYKRYHSRIGKILEWILPFNTSFFKYTWILKGLSFTISKGESVGIIGINGAGKSTLLKLICGTTQPTVGSIEVAGNVSALLELGLGFHPEFTGRQNIYMSGQIQGLSKHEIDQLIHSIEDFADIGPYIDEPVRVYSSGMMVRLAFAVATAKRPDILIVDEALSVGDIQFQQKCFKRIIEYRKLGTTLLFVTHDLNVIHTLCDRAILLTDGQIRFDGNTTKAVEFFYGYLNEYKAINMDNATKANDIYLKYDDINSYILSAKIVDAENNETPFLYENRTYCIQLEVGNLAQYKDPHIGIRIQDRKGVVMYESNTYCHKFFIKNSTDLDKPFTLNIKFRNNLIADSYTLAIGVESGGIDENQFEQVVCMTQIYMSFNVLKLPQERPLWAGVCNLQTEITVMQ